MERSFIELLKERIKTQRPKFSAMEARYIKHAIFIFGTLLCSVNAADKCLFGPSNTICNVTEGRKIQLLCRKNNWETVTIYKVAQVDFVIIKDNVLVIHTGEYRFHEIKNNTEKIYRLIINNVSRSHNGRYACLQTEPNVDKERVTLNVFYPPSKASCETDFDLFTTFKKDKIHTPFEGKCTVNDGYPSVKMSFSGISDSFGIKSTFNSSGGKIEGRFSILPDVTLNNYAVSCIVRQHYPTHLNLTTYFESVCSFPPFRFLAEFSVWITPSNVTIHKQQDIHFVCSSNAENVTEVSWVLSELPTGVSHSKNSKILTLHIRAEDSLVDRFIVITIKCQGHYRNRSNEDETFVNININRVRTISPAIYVFIILLLIFTAGLTMATIYFMYKKGKCRNGSKKSSSDVVCSENDPVAADQVCNEEEVSSNEVLSENCPSPGQSCSEKAEPCVCSSQSSIMKNAKKPEQTKAIRESREGIEAAGNPKQANSDGSENCLVVYRTTIIEDETDHEEYEVVGNSTTGGKSDLLDNEYHEYQMVDFLPK